MNSFDRVSSYGSFRFLLLIWPADMLIILLHALVVKICFNIESLLSEHMGIQMF